MRHLVAVLVMLIGIAHGTNIVTPALSLAP